MSTLPKKRYTVEEFLDLEEGAEYKSQFYNGEIFAMEGAALAHNRIAANFIRELGNKLRGSNCEVLPSDLLVMCPTGLYTYPDALVVCGKPETIKHRGLHVLLNPKVIIEVLSDSTESFDRGKKFTHYQSIPSMAEYLLVAQDRYSVDHFQRQGDGSWRLNSVTGHDAAISFVSFDCVLQLAAIYERVEVPAVDVIPRTEPPF